MSGTSLSWIRGYYGVPAFRGRPVTFEGRPGRITGSSGPHLLVRLDDCDYPLILHPTWHVQYPPYVKTPAAGEVNHAN